MQKLEGRDTYTPMGAPQAYSNCDTVIKHGHVDHQHDQVLRSLKTPSIVKKSAISSISEKRDTFFNDNNSDVDLLVSCGSRTKLESLCRKNYTSFPIPPRPEEWGILGGFL